MRTTLLFFGFMLLCLVLAALLTYPLLATGWIALEPQRVMGRLAQVLMLLGVWPFLRWAGLDNPPALGFGCPRRPFLQAIGRGWLIGVGILLVLVLALVLLGVRVPEAASPGLVGRVLTKALGALAGGLLIGLLEEAFFRGAMFTALRRRGGLVAAVGWSALLYALVHFMKPHGLPEGVALDWAGSWTLFTQVFTGLIDPAHLDSLAALFAAGVLLALVRERSGHIGWCIGLHAGWVFVIQVARRLTDADHDAALAVLAGRYDGVIGWLAAAWLVLITLGYWRWGPRRRAG